MITNPYPRTFLKHTSHDMINCLINLIFMRKTKQFYLLFNVMGIKKSLNFHKNYLEAQIEDVMYFENLSLCFTGSLYFTMLLKKSIFYYVMPVNQCMMLAKPYIIIEMKKTYLFLDKLDGLIHHNKKIAPVHQSMEDFLQLPDDYDTRPLAPGQKRVRILYNKYISGPYISTTELKSCFAFLIIDSKNYVKINGCISFHDTTLVSFGYLLEWLNTAHNI